VHDHRAAGRSARSNWPSPFATAGHGRGERSRLRGIGRSLGTGRA